MTSSSNVILLLFVIMGVLTVMSAMSYMASQRGTDKAKRSDGIALIQWPLPLIYSGLILIFMASALTESMPLNNVVLIGFAGIGLMGYGFFRLASPHGMQDETTEKKKKNEADHYDL